MKGHQYGGGSFRGKMLKAVTSRVYSISIQTWSGGEGGGDVEVSITFSNISGDQLNLKLFQNIHPLTALALSELATGRAKRLIRAAKLYN